MTTEATPQGLALTEGLGLSPDQMRMLLSQVAGELKTARAEVERLRFELGYAQGQINQAEADKAKAVAAEREQCAALCRRVADETRNSEDARAAGRMRANWISTGDPSDPEPQNAVAAAFGNISGRPGA